MTDLWFAKDSTINDASPVANYEEVEGHGNACDFGGICAPDNAKRFTGCGVDNFNDKKSP